jgi:putative ABC transport system permease protein
MLQNLSFILRNARRNRRRSLLTLVSVAISLALLGILMALYQSMFYPKEPSPSQALRLIVHHKVSLVQALPFSYKARLLQVPGVVRASTWQWFGGVYKDRRDPENFFARFGVDPEEWLAIRTDISMPEDQKRAFCSEQTGTIASKNAAARRHWKIGDRITLEGDIFPVTLDFTLVGIFDDPDKSEMIIFNNRYLQESLSATSGQRDTVGTYSILVDDASHVERVSKTIDDMFANSPAPTKTETEQQFGLSFLAFLGNLKLFLAAIGAAVTFTILLVSANTVAMTVRERVRETAILRTLGFTPGEIRGLVIGEAGLLSAIGGMIGAGLAAMVCNALKEGTMIRLPPPNLLLAAIVLAVAIVVGVLSATLPAYFAARRSVVESLRFAG